MIDLTIINTLCKGQVLTGESMKKHTTFKIGGKADYYISPNDLHELQNIIRFFKQEQYPYFIIGNGSNLLVSDKGYKGAIIDLHQGFNKINQFENIIEVGAASSIGNLVAFCLRNSLSGIEELAGIPGTIGGALIGNAGCYGKTISDTLISIKVLETNGHIKFIKKEEIAFEYRSSSINQIILTAKFRFKIDNPVNIYNKIKTIGLQRAKSQPLTLPSCGSVFKQIDNISAGKIIDDLGLKGKQIGGAMISKKHANFIINFNNATANDILSLIKEIKKVAKIKKNINLHEEVKYVGFE